MEWCGSRWLCASAGVCVLLIAAHAQADPVQMVLATTPKYTDEIRAVDGSLAANRPGHHAELMLQAGKQCGATLTFRFLPWQRALLEVKNGDIDGAFSSSYTPERATYGVYPLADGKPDPTRALKGYSYSLYVRYDARLDQDSHAITGPDRTVAVERGASVIPRLRDQGLIPVEIADNTTMLRMVAAGGRVAAAALMTEAADAILDTTPDLRNMIVKVEPPLEDKFGYVMLSKQFHSRHPAMSECFWTAMRDIRQTAEHAERIKSYQAEMPPPHETETPKAPAHVSEQGPVKNPS
ncbi:MAG: transporter substrate-binding domain-containing protein [Magnetospirillum sp.]|nr:transporter substrate-binding domain-containing protein [Magnetospirillum sp.]